MWFAFDMAVADLLVRIGATPWRNPAEGCTLIDGKLSIEDAPAFRAKVLACDEVIPEEIEITPAQLALGSTGLLCVQAILNFKAIKAEIKKTAEQREHDEALRAMKKRTAEAEAKHQAEEASRAAREAEARNTPTPAPAPPPKAEVKPEAKPEPPPPPKPAPVIVPPTAPPAFDPSNAQTIY